MTLRSRGGALVLLALFLLAWALGGRLPQERSLFLAAAHLGEGHATILVPLTRLGNFVLLGPASLLLALALARRRSWLQAGVYLVGTLVGRLGEDALKLLISRPRPALLPHLDRTWGTSFPSAHSFNATLVFVGFALAWGDRRLMLAAAALVGAIGMSRVLLAVHWPSDVLGGWSLGLLAALALSVAIERVRLSRHIRPAS